MTKSEIRFIMLLKYQFSDIFSILLGKLKRKGKGKMNEKKFFVIRQEKVKEKGKTFVALQCDLGYRTITVSFDTAVIAEVSGLTFAEIYSLEIGKKVYIK